MPSLSGPNPSKLNFQVLGSPYSSAVGRGAGASESAGEPVIDGLALGVAVTVTIAGGSETPPAEHPATISAVTAPTRTRRSKLLAEGARDEDRRRITTAVPPFKAAENSEFRAVNSL
jgi:hypothetical protein